MSVRGESASSAFTLSTGEDGRLFFLGGVEGAVDLEKKAASGLKNDDAVDEDDEDEEEEEEWVQGSPFFFLWTSRPGPLPWLEATCLARTEMSPTYEKPQLG